MTASNKATGGDSEAGARLSDTVSKSAQQIWLAGLGAFAKAQQEGGKVFESLVKEGVAIQRKTQVVAEEKMAEASTRMAGVAADLSSKASGQWDKLEGIFEDRVSRALKKLGVPTAADFDALAARIDELNRALAKANAGRKPAGTAAKTARASTRRTAVRKQP
jgi:poly(hydroxyalkanoate) granule-associated protein